MSDSNSAVLQRAFELVEAGRADEARGLVESVLEAEQSNPDAWWIYAHAVDDPVKARQALNEVLALDPEYPGANELGNVLDVQYPDAAEAARSATPILSLVTAGVAADGLASEGAESTEALAEPEGPAEDELAAEPEPEPGFVADVPTTPVVGVQPTKPRRAIPWWWYAAVAAIVVLLCGFLFSLVNRAAAPLVTPTDDLAATVVAGQPTLDMAAQSALETATALGLAMTESGPVTTVETGVEGTSEPVLPGETAAATSDSGLPIVVATLPAGSLVTLTPSSPEPVGTEAVVPAETEMATDMGGGEATSEAGLVTEVAATTPETTPGMSVPDAVVVIIPAETLNQLIGAMSAYSTPPDTSLTTEATTLGETLTAGFCTQEGPELRDLTRQVMDTVAAAAPVMAETTAAVGVRAVDCETGQTLRLIVVDRGTATLYTQGEINREGFESQWLSL